MAVAILNEQTIIRYVADEQAFNRVVIDHFITLDDDGDGTVSLDDFRRGFGKSAAMDEEEEDIEGQRAPEALYDIVFERFDEDRDGMLNSTEFQSLYVEMMLCLARGIGGMPISVALQDGSPFLNAVEHESSIGAEIWFHQQSHVNVTVDLQRLKKLKYDFRDYSYAFAGRNPRMYIDE